MKPKLKRFKEIAAAYDGNVSKIADALGVQRNSVYRWMQSDSAFKEIIEEYRQRLFDRCLETAKVFANGIPRMAETPEGVTQVGWIAPPDGQTLRYLLGVLGKKDGFGESIDVTTNGESIKPETLTIEVIDKREQVEK